MSQSLPIKLSSGIILETLIIERGGSPAEYDYMNVLGSAGIGELITAAEAAEVDLWGFSWEDPEGFEDFLLYTDWSAEDIEVRRQQIARQEPWFPLPSGITSFEKIRVWCEEHPDALDGEWSGFLQSAMEDIVWGLRLAQSEGVDGFRIES